VNGALDAPYLDKLLYLEAASQKGIEILFHRVIIIEDCDIASFQMNPDFTTLREIKIVYLLKKSDGTIERENQSTLWL